MCMTAGSTTSLAVPGSEGPSPVQGVAAVCQGREVPCGTLDLLGRPMSGPIRAIQRAPKGARQELGAVLDQSPDMCRHGAMSEVMTCVWTQAGQ